MGARIHHNDVMVGEFCSIRFLASRVVAVDRTKKQPPPLQKDDLQEPRFCSPELCGCSVQSEEWMSLGRIGDGLPTQAFMNVKRLEGLSVNLLLWYQRAWRSMSIGDPSQHTF